VGLCLVLRSLEWRRPLAVLPLVLVHLECHATELALDHTRHNEIKTLTSTGEHQGYRRVDTECDLLAVPHSQSGRRCLGFTLLLGERMGHYGGVGDLAGTENSRRARELEKRAGEEASRETPRAPRGSGARRTWMDEGFRA